MRAFVLHFGIPGHTTGGGHASARVGHRRAGFRPAALEGGAWQPQSASSTQKSDDITVNVPVDEAMFQRPR
jgi:hypothetical protein